MVSTMTTRTKPNHIIWLGVVFVVAVNALGSPANEAFASNDFAAFDGVGENSSCSDLSWIFLLVSAVCFNCFFWMSRAISFRNLTRLLWISDAIIPRRFYKPHAISFVIPAPRTLRTDLACASQPIFIPAGSIEFRDGFCPAAFATLFGGHGDGTSGACLSRPRPTGASFYHEMMGRRH